MAKKGQKYKKYSREFKINAVEKIISGEMTQSQVAREILGKPKSTGTINRWVDEYLTKGKENAFKQESRGRKKNPNNMTDAEFEEWILKKWRSFLEERLS